MNDYGMIRRPALGRVQARDRGGVLRIGAQSVHRFGGESDQPAGAQDLRSAADFGNHPSVILSKV